MENEKLIEMAMMARNNALAKITGFRVGAALLTKCGKTFLGCNIEDPSGVGVTTICAERCAIIKAISEGYTDYDKIVVVGGRDNLIPCMPCGVCRQFFVSFCPNVTILCSDSKMIDSYTLNDLLPHAFGEQF